MLDTDADTLHRQAGLKATLLSNLIHSRGHEPKLPIRTPGGYGHSATGGSSNSSAKYLVTNAAELREALALPNAKTICERCN
jgi:hypothetical protein